MRQLLGYILCLLMMVACGSESGKFRLEGRLRNINQGEFWVYSLDGAMVGIDTIPVRNGRFSYEMDLYDQTTLMIVFPNYSEQPVFAKSGAKVPPSALFRVVSRSQLPSGSCAGRDAIGREPG